jgi:hypothetical protein
MGRLVGSRPAAAFPARSVRFDLLRRHPNQKVTSTRMNDLAMMKIWLETALLLKWLAIS